MKATCYTVFCKWSWHSCCLLYGRCYPHLNHRKNYQLVLLLGNIFCRLHIGNTVHGDRVLYSITIKSSRWQKKKYTRKLFQNKEGSGQKISTSPRVRWIGRTRALSVQYLLTPAAFLQNDQFFSFSKPFTI